MVERKQRKSPRDRLDSDEHDPFILTEPECIEIASGYCISVKYDKKGRPVLYVKKYGDVDTQGLRRQIERSYPGASIQGLAKPKLVEVDDSSEKLAKPPVKKHRKDDKGN